MVGQSPPVIAAAAVALVVAFGGIGWTVASRSGAQAPEVVALTAAGLAGAVLVGLLPRTATRGRVNSSRCVRRRVDPWRCRSVDAGRNI